MERRQERTEQKRNNMDGSSSGEARVQRSIHATRQGARAGQQQAVDGGSVLRAYAGLTNERDV